MKTSSTSGTAYNSIGAGIIPALFVSIIATFWTVTLMSLISGTGFGWAADLEEFGEFIGIAIQMIPYGGMAVVIHATSIWLLPKLYWKKRAGLYALFGALIGFSFLRVQIRLDRITFENLGFDFFHILMISGALTALSVYAIYSAAMYVAKRSLRIRD